MINTSLKKPTVRTVLPHSRGLKPDCHKLFEFKALCSNGITPFSGIETQSLNSLVYLFSCVRTVLPHSRGLKLIASSVLRFLTFIVRTVLPHSRGLKLSIGFLMRFSRPRSNGITPFSGIETLYLRNFEQSY